MSRHCIALVIACVLSTAVGFAIELKSPDGNFVLAVDNGAGQVNGLQYSVSYKSKPIIVPSRLGLELEAGSLGSRTQITGTNRASHDSLWRPVCGERAEVRDHYNELALTLKDADTGRLFTVTFRAYDEGVAFRYTIPDGGTQRVVIKGERTEFRFPADHPAWATYTAQGLYQKVPLSQLKTGCERPLVVEMADDLCVAAGEANLVDFARMKFAPLSAPAHGVVSKLDGPVTASLPLTTPWRVTMAAESAGRLLENNYLFLNLAAPCEIADTSWIKPGKVIREVTLTTAGGKACVDFAVERGLQYIEFDAGWYGYEYDPKSDARDVHLDPRRSKGPLDLREVIRYGTERGIGVLLYVNHLALEKQIDELLPLYKNWGVNGIKCGFVNVGSQQWTSWLHESIRKCATNQLMVDVHDEYRLTGWQRTYPNLMTSEGIRGDETSPTNGTTLEHLFTRLLPGPADNTVCYYDKRVTANSTHAYQLAKPVCIFSPWQFLFWYDRPSAAPKEGTGGVPSQAAIGSEPELEFYNHLPTTWDDTKVLSGKIGDHALIARRKGEKWFIGYMSSGAPRALQVPLDFLSPGKRYRAWLYRDDPAVPTRTHIRIEEQTVKRGTVLEFKAGLNGGMAVRIEPATADVSRSELLDRIRGGWTGMLIGGIEGLAHEFKYTKEPRAELPDYPLLPKGARSDDDNDFEWTHLYFMDRENVLKLPYPRLVEIWKGNMNTGIWCANLEARKLMNEGVLPPKTADPVRNFWAAFNLSGQFCVESFGMIAPGMPKSAADLGVHYASVAVSGEPLQAARYWTTLISLAGVSERPIEDLLRESLTAVDPGSAHAEAVRQAINNFHRHPADWKAARRFFHQKWFTSRKRDWDAKAQPLKWNDNSTPLNGAMVVLALLYGGGDFYKTGQYAMALGYDADCNAATACAVIGMRIGYSGITKLPGFAMPDIYVNKSRPQLPPGSKVSEQAEVMLRLCEKAILENGGERVEVSGQPGFRIRLQQAGL